ncbi:MAG: AEC family transporter [Pseudomonadota bacterium]
MNLAVTVLEIVAPVFALAAIGFVWVKLGLEYRVQFVTRLAMTLGVPALIFVALMETEISPAALSRITLAAIAVYAALTVAAGLVIWVARLDGRTWHAPFVMSNTGNIGLPLAFFAFGDEGLGYAVAVFAVSTVFAFTIGIWLVTRTTNPLNLIKEPMVGATLLGALFLWQGWKAPEVVTNTLSLVGQLGIPLMLITLGVAIARITPTGIGRAALFAVGKVVICAAVATVIGLYFELPPVAFGILVLQFAAPAAVTSYLIAEKYGADSQSVAGLVVLSTALSVVSLPLILAAVL